MFPLQQDKTKPMNTKIAQKDWPNPKASSDYTVGKSDGKKWVHLQIVQPMMSRGSQVLA